MIWALVSKLRSSGKWPFVKGDEVGWWECTQTPVLAAHSVSSSPFPAGVGMMAWSSPSDIDRCQATKELAIVLRMDPSLPGLVLLE